MRYNNTSSSVSITTSRPEIIPSAPVMDSYLPPTYQTSSSSTAYDPNSPPPYSVTAEAISKEAAADAAKGILGAAEKAAAAASAAVFNAPPAYEVEVGRGRKRWWRVRVIRFGR